MRSRIIAISQDNSVGISYALEHDSPDLELKEKYPYANDYVYKQEYVITLSTKGPPSCEIAHINDLDNAIEVPFIQGKANEVHIDDYLPQFLQVGLRFDT